MRFRTAPTLAALLAALLLLAAFPARAGAPLPPDRRNPKGNDRTPQVLRPVPQAVVAPGAIYTVDDVPGAPIAIGKKTPCDGGDIERTFAVPESFTIYDVNLGFNADHIYRGDIRVRLQSPQGTLVEVITNDIDDSNDNFDLWLDDSSTGVIHDPRNDITAAPYYERTAQPSNALAAFAGEASAGTWRLWICDAEPDADDGAYNRARLELQSPPTGPALEASKTAGRHVVAAGMTIAYTITIHNGGLTGATGVDLSDPIPAGSTYVPGSVGTVGTPAATFNGTAIVWNGAVAAGATVVVSYQVTVTGSSPIIENTATVTHGSLENPLQPTAASQLFTGQDILATDETGYAIPDNGCASPLAVPIAVDQSFTVGHVRVGLNVNHTFRGDLSVSLKSPLNTEVQLIAPDEAAFSDSYDVLLHSASSLPLDDGDADDTGLPYYDRTVMPAAYLGAFEGEDAQGAWTLRICDSAEQDVGKLNHWSLFLYTAPLPKGTLEATKVVDWSGLTPDTDVTFEICITGPTYPAPGNCQTADYDGGALTWSSLIPGSYTITETDPGEGWTVEISGSPVTVPPEGGAFTATVTNTAEKPTEYKTFLPLIVK